MNKSKVKNKNRQKRHKRIRGKINGTPEKPRLVVFRSLKHIYAQIIDDINGKTLVNASSLDSSLSEVKGNKKDISEKVGEMIASRAIEKKIKKVVFDRNGYKYHGRIKIIAESARKTGLEF